VKLRKLPCTPWKIRKGENSGLLLIALGVLQHELIAKYGLLSFSVGEEPYRRVVVIYPGAEE